ncbi:MAG TPA: HAMP domain-containing sensor histidine kinase [Kofleriaceae bacterium]|nr:HAMP domain-containing sensor histidine kinase [Kofleriaceae bacterium]
MSIRLRFTLALTVVGLVLFGTYAVWSYHSEHQDLRASATKEIRIVGRSLETSLGNALRDQQRADVEETLTTLAAIQPDLAIHIHDAAGRPIAHSRGAAADEATERRIAAAARSGAETVAFEPAGEPTSLVFTGPLTADDGSLLGVVAVVRPIDDLVADLARTRDRLVLTVVVFLVVTPVAGLVLGTIQVTRPIARLLAGVRQVREGDFRARVQIDHRDEIGKLADEFNAMLGVLDASRTRTEAEADARSRLEAGLQRVDKLVTIGQLSAGLAHEIGSPLQVLSGRASALVEHADPEVRRQAGLLVAQCDRITRVVDQLLSFGRRRPAVVGPCDLAVPVGAVIDLLAGEARRRGVTLELAAGGGPHRIVGDVDQLQQVALNLVRNALQVTPRGGAIAVRIDEADGRVRLCVGDTGPGVDPASVDRLFEPFFTTRASDGGTGLGLAVVRAIADEHRAAIDVRARAGGGAEFLVSFPASPESAHA